MSTGTFLSIAAGDGASQSALRRTHPHPLAQNLRRRRNQSPSDDAPESDQDVDDSATPEKDVYNDDDDDDQEAIGGADEEDDGDQDEVIRCICTYTDDDGNTIACDECAVWQHMLCVGVDPANVPDQYHCEECAPRPIDPRAANELQKNQRAKKKSESPSDSSKGKRKSRKRHRAPPQPASEDQSPAPPPLRRAGLLDEARASRATSRGRGRPRGRARSSKESSSTRMPNTSTSRGGLTSSPELRRKVKEPGATLLARRARAPPETIYHHDRARAKRIEEERPRPADVFEHEYHTYSTRYAELSFPRFATEDVGDKVESICAKWDNKMGTADDGSSCDPTELNMVSARWLAERVPVAICDPLPTDPLSNVKRFGLFATSKIPANFYVTDVQGTIITNVDEGLDYEMTSNLPLQVSVNSTKLLAPYVFEHPAQMNLDCGLMIDARAWSSGAGRFVRRACSSDAPFINAHLRSVILKEDLPNNLRNPVNSRILLAIYTSRELRPSEEIVLGPSSTGCLGYPCACDDETVCRTAKLVDRYERQRRLDMEQKRLLQASLRRSYSGDQLDESNSNDVALSSSQEELEDGPEPELMSDSGAGEKPGRKSNGDSEISSPPSRAGKITNGAGKSLSREEKKLQDQLARIERMEREAERKRARKQRQRTKSGEASQSAAAGTAESSARASPARKRPREDSTTELDVDSESDDDVTLASKRRKQGAAAEPPSGQSTPSRPDSPSRASTPPKKSSPQPTPLPSKWHQPGRKLGFKGWIYAQEEARIAREAAQKAERAAAAAMPEDKSRDSALGDEAAVEPSSTQRRRDSNTPPPLRQESLQNESSHTDDLVAKVKVESDGQEASDIPVSRQEATFESPAVHPSVTAVAAPTPVRKVSLAEFMANKKARSEAALAEAALAAANAASTPPADSTDKPTLFASSDESPAKQDPKDDQQNRQDTMSARPTSMRETLASRVFSSVTVIKHSSSPMPETPSRESSESVHRPEPRMERRGSRSQRSDGGPEPFSRLPGADTPMYGGESRQLPHARSGRSISPNNRESYGFAAARSQRGSLDDGDPHGLFPHGADRRLSSSAFSNASEPTDIGAPRRYRNPLIDPHPALHRPSRSGSISYSGAPPSNAPPGPHIHPSRAQLRSPPPQSPAGPAHHDPYRVHVAPPTPHRPYHNPERERAMQGGGGGGGGPPPLHPERGGGGPFPRGRSGGGEGGRGAFRRHHPGSRYGPQREYFEQRLDVLDGERPPPRSGDARRDWERGLPPGDWDRDLELDREREWDQARERERGTLPPSSESLSDTRSGLFEPLTPGGLVVGGEHPQRKRRRDSDLPGEGRPDWGAESDRHASTRDDAWTLRQRPTSAEPPSLVVRRLSMISTAATSSGRPLSPEPMRSRDFGRRDERERDERDDAHSATGVGPGETGVSVRINRVENSMSEDRLRRLSEPERHEPRWPPSGGRGSDDFGPPSFQSKRSRRRGGAGAGGARRSCSRDVAPTSARNIWPPEAPAPKRQRVGGTAADHPAGTSTSSRSGSPRSRHSGVSSQPHSPPRLRIVTLDPQAPPPSSGPPTRAGSRSLSPRSRSPGSSLAGGDYDFGSGGGGGGSGGGGYPPAPRSLSGRPLSGRSAGSSSSSRRRRSDFTAGGGPPPVPVRVVSIDSNSNNIKREERSSPRPSSAGDRGSSDRYHPYARPSTLTPVSRGSPPPPPSASRPGDQQEQEQEQRLEQRGGWTEVS
ncbi:hypothetical protein HDU87_005113 [Geranomyces variabilis]|uniref:Zinc finger PHD-type domain-containing protein n=1 Tax=Geranomyces variabilis TaxID=109894 RepID=A0AAD5XTF6_9FUNG|nr:hypothetical protein HDU87_005113 [Geranomyces variabilis]